MLLLRESFLSLNGDKNKCERMQPITGTKGKKIIIRHIRFEFKNIAQGWWKQKKDMA